MTQRECMDNFLKGGQKGRSGNVSIRNGIFYSYDKPIAYLSTDGATTTALVGLYMAGGEFISKTTSTHVRQLLRAAITNSVPSKVYPTTEFRDRLLKHMVAIQVKKLTSHTAKSHEKPEGAYAKLVRILTEDDDPILIKDEHGVPITVTVKLTEEN